MLLGTASILPARGAEALAVELPAGPLWSALQYISRLSGQRILVPDGSARLEGVRHPSIAATLTLEAALDRLLAGTSYAWRRDVHGSVLIVAVHRTQAQLKPLRIAADAPTEASSNRDAWTRADSSLRPAGPGRVEGARLDIVPMDRFVDLLRRAPNISGQGEGLAIRGIERGAAAGATSSVYLDSIPLGARLLESVALPPLQRVDYLRGPRSLGDGAGAMAGVIRLETVEPQPEPALHGRIAATQRAGGELRLGASGQLGALGPAMSMNAVVQREGGSIDNPLTGDRDLDRGRQSLVQGRLLYQPDAIEALTLSASWLVLRADPGYPAIVPPAAAAGFDPYSRRSFDPLPRSRDLASDGAAFDAEWRISERSVLKLFAQGADIELGSVTRRRQISGERQARGEGEAAREFGVRWDQHLGSGWRAQLGVDRSERDTRLAESLITPLREFFPTQVEVAVSPDTSRLFTAAVSSDTTTRSAFAQIAWSGARTGIGLGVRGIDERRSSTRLLETRLSDERCTLRIGSGAVRPCNVEFPSTSTRQRTPSSDQVWVPNLRASWQPHPDHRLALELRRGFVGGGARLDTASGILATYDPERSDTLDLTWSGAWHGGRLRLDAAVFYNRWSDRQVPIDLPQRESYRIINAGAAHAYGGEFELQWQAHPTLQTWIGIGLLRTQYDAFIARVPSGSVELAGRHFPGAPPLTLTAGAQWRFAPDWQLGLSHWYSRAAYSDALNTPAGRRPSYAVLDLSLQHDLGARTRIELYARNALDRDYLEDVRIAGIQPRPREYLAGRERRVGVALEWRW